jgi:hypothetical protein
MTGEQPQDVHDERRAFARLAARVMIVQAVTLVLLWLLQLHYGSA